eukprot:Opistho-2@24344
MGRNTLFVDNVSPYIKAADLGYEFEKYGRLVRCDIPSSKRGRGGAAYAFVEYEDERDAEDAYDRMHNKKIDGYAVRVEWAKNTPSRAWRSGSPPPRRGGRGRSRSRSRSRSPRRSPPRRDRSRSKSRSASPAKREKSRSRSPSRSPVRGDDSESKREPEAGAEGQASPSR